MSNESAATSADAPSAGDAPQLIHAVPLRHWGRWIAVAVIVVLAAMAVHGLVTNKNYHWGLVLPMLFTYEIGRAICWTLILTVAAMAIGIVLAVTLAVMRRSDNPVMRAVATFYIWFFRGTPIYTQLIFWGLVSSGASSACSTPG